MYKNDSQKDEIFNIYTYNTFVSDFMNNPRI